VGGDPPACGGTCHAPRGFADDETFLIASAHYVLALDDFQHARIPQDTFVRELNKYRLAASAYLARLEARGIDPQRIRLLERLHSLWP